MSAVVFDFRRDRTAFVLLVLWTISTAFSDLSLDCTNDYDSLMLCHLEAQNCTEYNLTLRSNDGYGEKYCLFKQCDVQCCCSFDKMILVIKETHTAIVWRGADIVKSKTISITHSIKPKRPAIISVNESNGNFQVFWKSNAGRRSFSESLMASVTYHKKGDTQGVSELVSLATHNGLNYYEINGRYLAPSTTYGVSVKSYTNFSGKFSDSSEELEFTTAAIPLNLPLVILISLCFAAVIISSAIYLSFVKLKTKWNDTAAKCPNPNLLITHTNEEILKPVPPTLSNISVEPLIPDESKQWSKGSLRDTSSGSPQQSSTGSSCLSYANTEPVDIIAGVQDALVKAFANISPVSPSTTNPLTESNKDSGLLSSPYNPCGVGADAMSSFSSCFDNKTYALLIPSFPQQNLTVTSEVQTQAEMLCDSAYRPNSGDDVPCVDQQAPACPLVNFPPVVLSVMPTDMSYQQCNADSGGFSYTGDSSLSSASSGTNTAASHVSRVEAGCESFDEAVRGATKPQADENLCHSCVPAGSGSFPPVDDDYQPFQKVVEQPDILFSYKRSDEKEHLNKYPEDSFTKMPQSFLSPVAPGFINGVQGGQCFSLIPADQSRPLLIDSGYQCV